MEKLDTFKLSLEIEDAIYEWLNEVLEMPVIWDKQNAPRPDPPYAFLDIITGPNPIATQDEMFSHEDGTFEITGLREFTLSINVIAKNAFHKMQQVQISLNRPKFLEQLQLAGLAMINYSSVNDLSELLETDYEVRAQMDVRFYMVSTFSDREINTIEKVEIKSEVQEKEDTQLIS